MPILSVWLSPVFREELYSQPCYHAPTLSWLMKGFQHFSLSLSIFKCCDKLNKFKCVFNSFLGDLSWFQKNFSWLQKKRFCKRCRSLTQQLKWSHPWSQVSRKISRLHAIHGNGDYKIYIIQLLKIHIYIFVFENTYAVYTNDRYIHDIHIAS